MLIRSMESQLREILDPDQILAVLGKVLEQRLFMVIGILNRAGMDRWQGTYNAVTECGPICISNNTDCPLNVCWG